MPIIVRPEAAADIGEAFVWYERQHAGLGNEFLAAVQSAMGDVVAHPTSHPVIHRDTRRALVHRFPYGIFYRVYGKVVVVVACMHGRRDPRRWGSRT
jgi:plasmid stabilization system protein ParE